MPPRSEIARSLKGLWLLGQGNRAALSLFGTSRADVIRSFLAIPLSLPALLAYLILERQQYLAETSDVSLLDDEYYVKAVTIEMLALGLLPIVIALCVPLLRLPASTSSWVILNNWILVPGNYVVAPLVYLAHSVDDGSEFGLITGLVILAVGAIVLLAWCWAVLKTASGAPNWKVAFFLGVNGSAQYLLLTGLQAAFGIPSSYE
ncbi:hypothetical protein [Agrobacterium larrymoorei]|uniref:Uncharacterized protein n=1 Tax=Agrobacterium larrymoorei TaxID=160699 RepID=A0ABX8T4G9_9HYPH|nr:hypothetical protein [Agrobacterium larrymoorei]QYA08187.1 hypothetical protein J5285_05655 [Agrobacterium larrymoorei]